ncbi:endonuclease/exonuclease/phosphatase family protein [Allgaiera indica]|uniref:endonuclease/exonuclease/phosphatase family protein n=1 Tax=Allgaiera indica TaxID=765699 RepID=UPI00136425D9|nr:endonuclease/exonuclease/phosphatase family protein [Allgaiera indica]
MSAQAQGFVLKGFAADGFGDHPRSRSAHAIRVYNGARQRPVSITHMHGLRDLRVTCGDFNVEPGSETLNHLADHGFTELVTTRGFAGTRTAHYEKPGRFADYMLVNSEDAVRRFDVIRSPEVSDHCPLVLEV